MQSPADFWLQDSKAQEKVCVYMCMCAGKEKTGNHLEWSAQSHFTCNLAVWLLNKGISMQIQQSLGCHRLPISCIWFWWALMDCVSRWGRMSKRCSGCHRQERAVCVLVFPWCWLLELCWPAKIKAPLMLTGWRNWLTLIVVILCFCGQCDKVRDEQLRPSELAHQLAREKSGCFRHPVWSSCCWLLSHSVPLCPVKPFF